MNSTVYLLILGIGSVSSFVFFAKIVFGSHNYCRSYLCEEYFNECDPDQLAYENVSIVQIQEYRFVKNLNSGKDIEKLKNQIRKVG